MINRIRETPKPENTLPRQVIGLAMKVHRTLGCGFVETVYRNALVLELRKAGIAFECHPILPVIYDGEEIGVFQADLIIEKKLILELKAVEALAVAHSVQLINYLAAAKIEEGLLLNFGTKSLEFKTKNRTASYKRSAPPDLQS